MSDTTVAEEIGISTSDLKALRNAEAIVFRYSTPERGGGFTVGAAIEASKSHDPGDGFGKRELTVVIPCMPSKVTQYGPGRKVVGTCSVFTSAKFNPELQTALAMIKPGDILTPEYVTDNNTEIARKAGLHLDETKLRVVRAGAGGGKVFTFMLHMLVIPEHSAGIRDVAFA